MNETDNLRGMPGGSVPVPDPTVLTTQQLMRAVEKTEEIVLARLHGVRENFETRLNGMDRAIALLQQSNDKIPDHILASVDRLQELHQEKFASIAVQFAERDKRTEQLSLADKTAIAAALQAQKEAAGAQNESNAAANVKMETNFAKLIDQGQALLLEVRRNTEAQINDIKSRLDKGEGRGKGMSDGYGWIIGAIGALAGIAGIVSLAMTVLMRK